MLKAADEALVNDDVARARRLIADAIERCAAQPQGIDQAQGGRELGTPAMAGAAAGLGDEGDAPKE